MITCPECGDATNVTDSRGARRRRKCPSCGHKFTTYEITRTQLKHYKDALRRYNYLQRISRELRRERSKTKSQARVIQRMAGVRLLAAA